MVDLRNVIVVDTETTGTNPFVHDILSLALVPVDRRLPTLDILIKSDRASEWSAFARENFKNFSHDWRERAVDAREAARQIRAYLATLGLAGRPVLAGHNIGFDRAFIQKLAFSADDDDCFGFSHRNIDTHTLIATFVILGVLPETSITSTGAFEHFGIRVPLGQRHTAMGDAVATRELVECLMDMYASQCG
jgi:DNA polymerase III epsilon subunit-like protein